MVLFESFSHDGIASENGTKRMFSCRQRLRLTEQGHTVPRPVDGFCGEAEWVCVGVV